MDMDCLRPQHRANLDRAMAVLASGVLTSDGGAAAAGASERAIEVAFAAQYIRNAKRMLDVGFTFASPDYMGLLLAAQDAGVAITGLDIIPPASVTSRYPEPWREAILQVPVQLGDVRSCDLPDQTYDLVALVSTLEHVGFDAPGSVGGGAFDRPKALEDVKTKRDPDTDARVMAQCAKALQPGGIVVVTVPMGRGGPAILQDSLGLYACQYEYNASSWAGLMAAPGFEVIEQAFYRETEDGWRAVTGPGDLSDVSSHGRGHAAGCALAALRRI